MLAHPLPPTAAVRGLQVSRGDVLQDLLLQGELGHQPLQPRILALKVFQPFGLLKLAPLLTARTTAAGRTPTAHNEPAAVSFHP
jgi:hypothetical protein